MAAVIQASPSLPACLVESSKVLFDYPNADVILRSHDSQTFQVLKLYIINSSTVLGELVQAAPDTSDATNSAGVQIQLPEVQLSESSAVLSSLLTFIFPVNPVLPSTLEERMELLSVAQKYEMSTVLTHIRGFLSRQHPPFIGPENAFFAYSLTQKYRLREEAIQAARLTLKFILTIETLEDKLAIMAGAYLYELWKYHQKVQALLKLDLPSSGASAALKGVNCPQCTKNGSPYWIDLYIWSIIEHPSRFDSIEFQMALARHTGTTRCSSCILIPVEKMRTFWTILAASVHHCMEKAESKLSIFKLGTETNLRCYMGPSAVPLPPPECLDLSDADVVVRTSDLTSFLAHKSVLASSSWIFRDMFTLPWPPNNEMVNGLPVVDISEENYLHRTTESWLCLPPHRNTIWALSSPQSVPRSHADLHLHWTGRRHFMRMPSPMMFEYLGDELELFEGRALRELASFRKGCRDNLVSCIESFLSINSASKIWVDCPRRPKTSQPKTSPPKTSPPTVTLPTWVHNLFSPLIEELKQAFTSPLIKPSSIREKYLEGLRKHAAPDLCTFCLGVHALKGEWYCMQLEKALAQAREKMPVIST